MSVNPIPRKEAVHFVSSLEKKAIPKGISSESSIAPADPISFSAFQQKPDAPNFMFSVILCYRREEDGMYIEAIIFDKESTTCTNQSVAIISFNKNCGVLTILRDFLNAIILFWNK